MSCWPPVPCPIELPVAPFDGKQIVDSWGALEFEAVPKRLGVIGAGVIGLELGSVWRRLGAEVVMLEALREFLAMADRAAREGGARHFKKQGLDIRLGAKVTGAAAGERRRAGQLQRTPRASSRSTVDRVVVAVGRRPFTQGPAGRGHRRRRSMSAASSRSMITAAPASESVWAVGDCVRGPMLAHKGKEEGVAVADLHRRPLRRTSTTRSSRR